MITEIVNYLKTPNVPFGLEVGFGRVPSAVWRYPSVPLWIATEIDLRKFLTGQQNFASRIVHGVPEGERLDHDRVLICLQSDAPELHAGANVVLYRNPHSIGNPIPHARYLPLGQRQVVIISGFHFSELRTYAQNFVEKGYKLIEMQGTHNLVPPGLHPDEYKHVVVYELRPNTSD
jgi:hypothetical protein